MPAGTTGQGAAIGAMIGGPVGGVVGAAAGNWIGGLFSHHASGKTLNQTYNNMRDWARDLVTLDEFTALESNRQAGFFANNVVPTISDRINALTGPDSIESYRAWAHSNYKPNVVTLTDRLLNYKAQVIAGGTATPAAQGAVNSGAVPGGTVQAPPTTPGSPSQAGFKLPTWAIIGLITIGIYFLIKGGFK